MRYGNIIFDYDGLYDFKIAIDDFENQVSEFVNIYDRIVKKHDTDLDLLQDELDKRYVTIHTDIKKDLAVYDLKPRIGTGKIIVSYDPDDIYFEIVYNYKTFQFNINDFD